MEIFPEMIKLWYILRPNHVIHCYLTETETHIILCNAYWISAVVETDAEVWITGVVKTNAEIWITGVVETDAEVWITGVVETDAEIWITGVVETDAEVWITGVVTTGGRVHWLLSLPVPCSESLLDFHQVLLSQVLYED